MNYRIRIVLSVLFLSCSFVFASGCALFQKEPPKQINTVSDWMKQDRVKP